MPLQTICERCAKYYANQTQCQNPVIQTNMSNTDITTNLCKSVKSMSIYFSDTDYTDLHRFYLKSVNKNNWKMDSVCKPFEKHIDLKVPV